MEQSFSLLPESFSFALAGISVERRITLAADVFAGASVLLAIFAFLINQWVSRGFSKRQHTMDILEIINTDGPVFASQRQAALWIRDGKVFPDDCVSDDEDNVIMPLLDYYDFVCQNIKKGNLDRQTVYILIGGRMRSAYFMLEHYIVARRERLRRENLYRPMEDVVRREIPEGRY